MAGRVGALMALVLAGLLTTTAPAATRWSKPLHITPRDGYAIYLDLAVGTTGDVEALGVVYSEPDGLVNYSSHDRGPFEGDLVNHSGADFPPITIDRDGTVLILSHRVGTDNAVRVYSKPRGGSFGSARVIDARPGEPSDIATSPAGEVFAYWRGGNVEGTETTNLRVAVRPAGSDDFGPVQDLSAPMTYIQAPRIVFDRAGNALIMWEEAGGVRYALRRPGMSFGPAHVLASSGRDLDLAANRAGRAVAVFRPGNGEPRELRAAIGGVASGFDTSRHLGGQATRGPEVVVDRAGQAVVTWRGDDTRPSTSQTWLRVAVARPGHGFGLRSTLYEGFIDWYDLATDNRGTATVAWLDARQTLSAARYRSGEGAFKVEAVDRSKVHGFSMNATRDGRTVLAWKATAKRRTKRARTAVARPGHSFGAPTTLVPFARGDYIEGPYLDAGGDGGAFAWWGTHRTRKRHKIWFSGSYLLP